MATATRTWTHTSTTTSTDWSVGSNWSGGSVPGPNDTALIQGSSAAPASVSIAAGETEAVGSVQLNGFDTLTLGAGATLVDSGAFVGLGAGQTGSTNQVILQGGTIETAATGTNQSGVLIAGISLDASTTISGFGVVESGTANAPGTIVGRGTFIASGGTLDVIGSMNQSQSLNFAVDRSQAGSTLEFGGGMVPGDYKVSFTGSGNGGTVEFAAGALPSEPAGYTYPATGPALNNMGVGDELVFLGQSVMSVSVGTGTATGITAPYLHVVLGSGGTATGSENFFLLGSSPGVASDYQVVTGPDGQQDAVREIACFVRGTRIATARGEVAVEELREGDRLLTAAGSLRPLRWVGRRAMVTAFIRPEDREAELPVRIARGALGGGLPKRDLLVSPEHAMLLDGVLIPAGALVNGVSITRCDTLEVIEYYHLELPTHDVILAEGAPSESYLDTGNRCMFENVAEYVARYGFDLPAMEPCLPIVKEGAALETVRHRLAEIAGEIGGDALHPGAVAGLLPVGPAFAGAAAL